MSVNGKTWEVRTREGKEAKGPSQVSFTKLENECDLGGDWIRSIKKPILWVVFIPWTLRF